MCHSAAEISSFNQLFWESNLLVRGTPVVVLLFYCICVKFEFFTIHHSLFLLVALLKTLSDPLNNNSWFIFFRVWIVVRWNRLMDVYIPSSLTHATWCVCLLANTQSLNHRLFLQFYQSPSFPITLQLSLAAGHWIKTRIALQYIKPMTSDVGSAVWKITFTSLIVRANDFYDLGDFGCS